MSVSYQKSFLIEMLARIKKITYICLPISTLWDKDGHVGSEHLLCGPAIDRQMVLLVLKCPNPA